MHLNLVPAVLTAALLTAFPAAAETVPEIFRASHCSSCHAYDHKILGPSYKDIAIKYKTDRDAVASLVKKIRDGGGGVWGAAKMPPHPSTPEADLKTMVEWILAH